MEYAAAIKKIAVDYLRSESNVGSPIFLPEFAFFLYDGNEIYKRTIDKSVVFSIHSCNTTILYLLITFTHVPTKYLLPQTNFSLDHAKTNLDIHLKNCYSEHQ